MEKSSEIRGPDLTADQKPAIRFLVESALRSMVADKAGPEPRNRIEWIERLGDALMAEESFEYQKVLSSLVAKGISTEELYQFYIPEASRYMGEKWVTDEASFVDVTTGASRLQSLFRDQSDAASAGQLLDRSIPLGQSVLMVIPQFEQHSLGAFVAADGLRRHGLWVRMAIGLTDAEIAQLIEKNRFSLVGVSLATWNSVENTTGLVDYLRQNVESMPPIVAGGRIIEDVDKVKRTTGVDFAVKSVREAIKCCGLSTVAELSPF